MLGARWGIIIEYALCLTPHPSRFKAPVKKIVSQEGNLMLMTLMVLLVLSVLGATVLGVAGMENKVSHYGAGSLQAQQAADAGVEWAIEELWKEGLPETFHRELVLDNSITSGIVVTQRTGGSQAGTGNGNNGSYDSNNQAEQLECSYKFTSTGNYRGITKKVAVEIVYKYSAAAPAGYDSVEIRSYTSST
ncbi:MAG: PilX N-terminal domain-containing pilus assembly protein [Syntrophomonas sp.]